MTESSPFLIPTASLRFTSKIITPKSTQQIQITKTPIRIPLPDSLIQKLQLDDETRHKLSRLIHEKKEKYKGRRKKDEDDSLFEGGDFAFFTSVKGALGLSTYPLLDSISLEMLVGAKITVKDLITTDGVSIATLKKAGIINNFNDLQALGFEIMDLVRNRSLFSVNIMVMLFHTHFDTLYKTKKSFTAKDLVDCHFYACELNTLNFTIEQLINDDKVTKKDLFLMGFDPLEWISLKLKRVHLTKLKISHPEALRQPPSGFGWTEQEYQQFAHPNK